MSGQRQMNAEMPVSLLTTIPNGTVRDVDGRRCIWFDGYWIRHYDVPQNEDVARREPVSYTHLTLPTICSV